MHRFYQCSFGYDEQFFDFPMRTPKVVEFRSAFGFATCSLNRFLQIV